MVQYFLKILISIYLMVALGKTNLIEFAFSIVLLMEFMGKVHILSVSDHLVNLIHDMQKCCLPYMQPVSAIFPLKCDCLTEPWFPSGSKTEKNKNVQ